MFARWGETHDTLDILVHALAFAKREDLEGEFVDTSRDGFALALDISAYSLVALAREARPLLRPGSSIITLTYYGAEKVVANYNVMGVAKAALEASVRYLAADLGPDGVRVNAISAGPVRTLAAAGSPASRGCTAPSPRSRRCAPTSRSRTSGGRALYLASDLSRRGDRRDALRRRRLQHHGRADRATERPDQGVVSRADRRLESAKRLRPGRARSHRPVRSDEHRAPGRGSALGRDAGHRESSDARVRHQPTRSSQASVRIARRRQDR